jgi:hypothetical protein
VNLKFLTHVKKGKESLHIAPIEKYQIDLERPTNFAATNSLKSSQAPQSIK